MPSVLDAKLEAACVAAALNGVFRELVIVVIEEAARLR